MVIRQKSDGKSTNIIIKVENLERPKRRKPSKPNVLKRDGELRTNRPSSSCNSHKICNSSLKRKSPAKSSSPSFDRHNIRNIDAENSGQIYQSSQMHLTLDELNKNKIDQLHHYHHHHHYYHHHRHIRHSPRNSPCHIHDFNSFETEIRNEIDKDQLRFSPTLSIISGNNEQIVHAKTHRNIFNSLYNQGILYFLFVLFLIYIYFKSRLFYRGDL